MNELNKYLTSIIISIFVISCNEPAPIELINNDESNDVIEIINENPGSYTLTGYDSTGVIEENSFDKSLVVYSGIKNTYNNLTRFSGYGEAIFIDNNQPIKNSENKIVGYKTIDFGKVKFNNHPARVIPYSLKFLDNFKLIDTLVGVKNVLYHKRVLLQSVLNFPYNSNIPLSFTDQNNKETISIMKIPNQISGKISVTGSRETEDFEVSLEWNNENSGEVQIIIGAKRNINDELTPFFRIKNPNKNRIVIPNNLLRQILKTNYKYLIFTFVKKIIEKPTISNLGEIQFAAQSIHNIWVDIR
ncbi:MAG: hypothetical protein IPM32_01260 [Ignavibacteriae bacterium]|nr:hypothetical protein [Ignavibacteriota bacterium]